MSNTPEEVGKTVRLALRLALATWGDTVRFSFIALVATSCLLVASRYTPVTTVVRPSAIRIDLSAMATYGPSEHSDHGSSARPLPCRFTD